MSDTPLPSLFPEIQPFTAYTLPVDNGHVLYVEQSGNPSGLPVIVLHGGPGSGCSDKSRRRFDPTLYHIICFDQRGAGRSTPSGHLVANTTADLVRDIETIRTHLGLDQWVAYGTSWGSTLALAYAQTHPHAVLGLVIGGIFLGTQAEVEWFNMPNGLPQLRWPQYQALQNLLPQPLTGKAFDEALLAMITGPDPARARAAAEAFTVYEASGCDPIPDEAAIRAYVESDAHLVTSAAIELHYFVNHCFLTPGQLMTNLSRVAHLPVFIVQGGLDLICPPAAAQRLHAALPGSHLTLVPASGHYSDPALEAARVAATTAMARHLRP